MANITNQDAFRNAMAWAQQLVKEGFTVIDTETTGFKEPQICEISVVGYKPMEGEKPLLNQRVKPSKKIEQSATEVHGITDDMVKNEPVFADIWVDILKATSGFEHVLMYNAPFDRRALRASACGCGFKLAFASSSSRNGKVWHTGALIHCAMQAYTGYAQLPKSNGNGFKYPKLPVAPDVKAHTAEGDAISVVRMVEAMAKGEEVPHV